jgi:hypothetical protein
MAGRKADARSERAQKQPTTRRFRATITQVGGDGSADVWRNRHRYSLPAPRMNAHLAGSPIDIIQCNTRDFVGPQAELCQHRKDGVGPLPDGGCSIATIEDILHLFGGQIGWQVRELPLSTVTNQCYASGQKDLVQPLVMKVSKKCTQ